MLPNGTVNRDNVKSTSVMSNCISMRGDATNTRPNHGWSIGTGISPCSNQRVLPVFSGFPSNVHRFRLSQPNNFHVSESPVSNLSCKTMSLNASFRLFPRVLAQEHQEAPAPVSSAEPVPLTEQPKPKISYEPPPGETGRDRLRTMYSLDTYGSLGPEWSIIKQGFQGGIVSGVALGIVFGGKEARIKHLDTSHSTIYQNEMAGRRALQDKMTLGMFRGAVLWGWRTSLFTTLYLGTATHLSVYNGKSSMWDFTIAGGVTGLLWKFMQGPRASLTSGVLGVALGFVSGAVSLGVLSLFDVSLEQLRYEHYHLQPKMRSETFGRLDFPAGPPPGSYSFKSATYMPDATEQKSDKSSLASLPQTEPQPSLEAGSGQ